MSDVQPFRTPALELRHLAVVAALGRTGRLADAAADLNVTPSALSHRIREAEKRLGIPLYVRANRRLEPTPAAEFLAGVADRLLGEAARAESDARRMTRTVRHVVRIAVEAYTAYHWLPDFIRFVRGRVDDLELQVVAESTQDQRARVVAGGLDVALVSGDRPVLGVRQVHLFDDPLVFLVPPEHRLAGRPFVDGPDIVGEDFITYTRTPEPDREFALLFRPTDSYPSWTETVEAPEAIVEMVAAGLGLTVLSRWAVERAIADGRVVESGVGPDGITVPWYAVVRAGEEDGSPADLVAALLAEWCGANGGLAAR